MKQTILLIITTGSFFYASAQQAKPVKAPQPATQSASEGPKALVQGKPASETNTGKPIVPGGEFKPSDTRIHPLANAVEPRPAVPAFPVNAPVPSKKTEEKKPAAVPVQQQ